MTTTQDNTIDLMDDPEEILANELDQLLSKLTARYLARPEQAATNEENDEMAGLIEWLEELTTGWPCANERLDVHICRYNSIHCD